MKHLKNFDDLEIKLGETIIDTEYGLMRIDKITRMRHNGMYFLHLNTPSKKFDPDCTSFSCDIVCPDEYLKSAKEIIDLKTYEGSKYSSNWSDEEKRKDKNDKSLKDLSFTKLIEEFENKLIAYHGISVGDQKTIDKIKKEILDRYSQK